MDGIDLGQLESLAEDLEPSDLADIVAEFSDDIDACLARLKSCIAHGRAEDAVRALHEMKGCALNIGLVRLAEVTGRHERALEREADLASVPLGKIDTLARDGCATLRGWIEEPA